MSAAAEDQSAADVATNGTDFLVVWHDTRNYVTSATDIYAARVTSAGVVLAPFAVCESTGSQSYPRVASDGTDFLVVWQHKNVSEFDVHAARVAADGTVLDVGGFAVSTETTDEKFPDVAWTGLQYAVAWEDARDLATSDWDVFAARVAADGTVADPSGIKVTGPGKQDSVAVAGEAGDVLVVFRDGAASPDIQGAVVDATGSVSVTPFDIGAEASTQKSPAVAFASGVFVVAWEDYRASSTPPYAPDVYVARVSTAGALLDPSPHVAVASDVSRRSAVPSVALDGGNVLVAWEEGDPGDCDVRYARVLADATGCTVHNAIAPMVYAGSGDQIGPAVASWGSGALVVWSDDRNDPGGAKDVFGTILATNEPPVAEAGPDVSVLPGAAVLLDGSASLDPEAVPLAFAWIQESGAPVALLGAGTTYPGFTAPGAEGALEFGLTVSDGVIASADGVTVTVSNAADSAPVASNVVAVAVDSYSFTVGWDVDLLAYGSVLYGTTPALGSESPRSAAASFSPGVTLTGLRAGATYHYAVRSVGENCAWSVSGVATFTLDPPPASDDDDEDGLPNDWELIWFGTNTAAVASADSDVDGLANLDEYRHGTDPWEVDTDNDGAFDGHEVLSGANPLRSDSVPPRVYPPTGADSGCSIGALSGAGQAAGAEGALLTLLVMFLLRGYARLRVRRTGTGRTH
ncbi:MAG: PKD domain-containing protein [Planctomycetota bacterium]